MLVTTLLSSMAGCSLVQRPVSMEGHYSQQQTGKKKRILVGQVKHMVGMEVFVCGLTVFRDYLADVLTMTSSEEHVRG